MCRHVSSVEATDDEEEMDLVKKKLTKQQGTRTQPNRGYAQQQNKKVRDKTKVDCGYCGIKHLKRRSNCMPSLWQVTAQLMAKSA